MVFDTSITMQNKGFLNTRNIFIAWRASWHVKKYCWLYTKRLLDKIYYLYHAGFHLPPLRYILIPIIFLIRQHKTSTFSHSFIVFGSHFRNCSLHPVSFVLPAIIGFHGYSLISLPVCIQIIIVCIYTFSCVLSTYVHWPGVDW